MGIISSSISCICTCPSDSVFLGETLYSKAARINPKATTNPSKRNTFLLFSRSAFGDFLTSIVLLFISFFNYLHPIFEGLKIKNNWHSQIRSEEHTSELQSRPHLVC